MFKHILVPTDGSPLSQDAVRKAVPLAKENGAKVTALYVKLPAPAHYWSHVIWVNLPEPSAFEEFAEKEAQEALAFVEGLCREHGVKCSKFSVTNEPAARLIEESDAAKETSLATAVGVTAVYWNAER